MRIIAGLCKGKNLKSLKGMNTRPTSDRVKEAVFSVLTNKIVDQKVLDLFGGTGNIGLEALSRGCSSVVFVEKNIKAMQIIKENVADCGFAEKVSYFNLDAFKAVSVLKENKQSFNLIYLDPPYNLEILDSLLETLVKSNILEPLAIIVVESSKNTQIAEKIENLEKVKENIYGDTKITYYQLL
ncbi:16S rRNA (guanine(966)-N(2))-methyltransferase RsmD [Desulfonispora thiosulfatigenes DSM 11270]|uniref:16S rRNA (Guanine(966)-N(2))-methyltransferase RsmD n=1 Tax=Desulfonispora thiosulfatigenes DSM 11270 TaxID=656914 RepID=A0A1W1VJQ2_DESTI|nr:16S rRNA (guanine(966)-N(2))-methyltransferase RsmD [Desulfonispora thiosulfatigenes]SMB93558.1 16S rRNA (guanine(966)-N(2))-methyltransferase RsmD [Desulfonispora thiosulfatigenes DSM 11270]